MAVWQKIRNVFRSNALNRELDEEFESHIAEAVAQGRDPHEARRSFGPLLRQREASREFRVLGWLDGVRADVIFGSRQLRRNRVTAIAAVLSLALAMGACVSAFRLIDALLWRPLPVEHARELYALTRSVMADGVLHKTDTWAYPNFVLMRDAVKDQAKLLAVSPNYRVDITYSTDTETEKVYLQHVSGEMFADFGLNPVLGRVLTDSDDKTLNGAPYAVISYDYWKRRFAKDPEVVGKLFHLGGTPYEIVGVGPETFTGTETGTMTEVFVPAMMNLRAARKDASWTRVLAIVAPEANVESLRAKLDVIQKNFERERLKGVHLSPERLAQFAGATLSMEPATAGYSLMQEDYRRAMSWLCVLVALVLLIACVNVANLMTALAASRAREMALRVSIGAGRMRLVQMVMIESAMLAAGAIALGAVLAWWSAPWVLRLISTPDAPARLALPADWRVMAFGLLLVCGVVALFGLAPALRASGVKPASALKGGNNPHARRRGMHWMITAQVAFCFVVVFAAGLFVRSARKVEARPLGFDPSHLLLLETVTPHGQTSTKWNAMAETLRGMPGVKSVGISEWALLQTGSWNGNVSVNGNPATDEWAYFLAVSPGWMDTMKMRLVEGREITAPDTWPGAVVVNQAFVRDFLRTNHPLGMRIEKVEGNQHPQSVVVGVVEDAPYRFVHEEILPTVFVPLHTLNGKGGEGLYYGTTLTLRVDTDNPMTMAQEMRKKVWEAGYEMRVSDAYTQQDLIDMQTVRDRMLAMLGMFFAGIALLLAGIGLYGVLNYSVVQRRREIGIRMALGARRAMVAGLVTTEVAWMVALGCVTGCAVAVGAAKYMAVLLYQVNAGAWEQTLLPLGAILCVAMVATVPAVMYALEVEPAEILRTE
jgi:putative ABC transport system permease protein